jgi:hypothetical protein
MSYRMVYKKQFAEQELRRARYRLRKLAKASGVVLFAAHGRVAGCESLFLENQKAWAFLKRKP